MCWKHKRLALRIIRRRNFCIMIGMMFVPFTLTIAIGMCIVLAAAPESSGISGVSSQNGNIYVVNADSLNGANSNNTNPSNSVSEITTNTNGNLFRKPNVTDGSPHSNSHSVANSREKSGEISIDASSRNSSDILRSITNKTGRNITNVVSVPKDSASTANFSISTNTRPSVPTGPYDLSKGPLTCGEVWPLLRKKDKGKCKLLWQENSSLPDVLCALIGGYKPIAGSYTTLIYTAATYHIVDTPVGNASAGDGASGRCAYQTRFELRKVDRLSDVDVPVQPDESLLQITQSEKGPSGLEGDTQLALVSQGLKSVRLDLKPEAVGAKGAMLSIPPRNCSNCSVDVWVIEYAKTISVVHVYLNRAWRITMEFNPAYMKLATFLLSYLRADADVEELLVMGGERWDDAVVLPATLARLRKIDFSSNGLIALDDVNFERAPGLTELNLSNNNFSAIPRGVSLLRQLRSLDLSRNPLAPTPFAPLLRPLALLRRLSLAHAPLGGFQPLDDPQDDASGGDAKFLPLLEELDLRGCRIASVDDPAARRVLRGRRTLQRLVLSGNPLAEPPPPALVEGLLALRELAMADCGLSAPPALRLAPDARLDVLDLSRNALKAVEGVVAPDAAGKGVGALDVSWSQLGSGWGADAFAALGAGASVNLSHSGVSMLTPAMLRALEPLRQVDLGFNPIDCNQCATLGLREWLTNRTQPEVLTLGQARAVRCLHPPAARGRPVLTAREWPSRDLCSARARAAAASAWNGAAVVGAVVGGALLAAGILALLAFRFRLELVYVLHVLRANRAVKAAPSQDAGRADEEDWEFDAFVCYSKFDRAWVVGELLPRLEGSSPRYRLCLHERDFPLGSLIVQNIVECMARSRRTLIVLTRAFIDSQWCQWELEMATHRLLDSSCRDYLVLVELERLETRALPRLLRLLVETRTFLQWPATGCAPSGCCGRGGETAVEAAWRRLRAALGPPLRRPASPDPSNAPTGEDSLPHAALRFSFRNKGESQSSETPEDPKSQRNDSLKGRDSPANNSIDLSLNRRNKILSDSQRVPRKRNSLRPLKSKDSNLTKNQDTAKDTQEVCVKRVLKECNKEKSQVFPVICDDLSGGGVQDSANILNNLDTVDVHNSDDANIVIQQNTLNILKNQNSCVSRNPFPYRENSDNNINNANRNNYKPNLSSSVCVINVADNDHSSDIINSPCVQNYL